MMHKKRLEANAHNNSSHIFVVLAQAVITGGSGVRRTGGCLPPKTAEAAGQAASPGGVGARHLSGRRFGNVWAVWSSGRPLLCQLPPCSLIGLTLWCKDRRYRCPSFKLWAADVYCEARSSGRHRTNNIRVLAASELKSSILYEGFVMGTIG